MNVTHTYYSNFSELFIIMNSILATLYIYFFFPYKKLIINIFVFSFIKLEFYIYTSFCIIIYLYLLPLIIGGLKKKLSKIKTNIYFKSISNLIKSYFIVFIFTIYYIVYLRLLTLLANRNLELNIFFYKKYLIIYASQYFYSRFVVIAILISIMLICCILFSINYVVFFFYKLHYLKLHYYKFLRNENYRKVFALVEKIEVYLFKNLGAKYKMYVFIRQYLLLIFMVIYILINILFNEGEIGSVLKLFPYYSLYYFIINIYSYIFISFKHDFDVLIMEFYYKKLNFLMEKNELKKKEYIKNLLFSNSKFVFEDCIYYDCLGKIKKNYSTNKPPNDFFSKIKKCKPEIPKVL